MATKKSVPQKAVTASKTTKNVAPAKKAVLVKSAVPAKKAAPTKVVAPVKKATALAKPAPKAVPVKKAAPAKVVAPVKKAAPAAKVVAPLKKAATPAKPAPKAVPVKKAVPVAKVVAPVKKAAPAAKIVAPVKKAATPATPAPKAVPAKKAAPAAKVVAPVKKTVVPVKPAPKAVPEKKVVVPAKKEVEKKPEIKVVTPVKKEKIVAEKPVKKVIPKKVPPVKVPEKEREDRRPVVIKEAKVATEDLSLKKTAVKPIKEVKLPKLTSKSSVPYQPGYIPLDKRVEADKPNTPLVKYSDNDLNEFREIIGKKLAAAKKELAYLQGMFARKDADGESEEARYMTMEDGTISMEREQLGQMAGRQVTYIDHLEKALIRIENKTYGVCRVTGKLIDKARLRAVPHATLSLEAKLGLHNPKGD